MPGELRAKVTFPEKKNHSNRCRERQVGSRSLLTATALRWLFEIDSGKLCLARSGDIRRASGQCYIPRGKSITAVGEGESREAAQPRAIADLCGGAGFPFRLSASCESAVAIPTRANTFSEALDKLRAQRSVCSLRPE